MNCSHGSDEDSICMLCIREGEGKPSEPKKEEAKSWEDCMSEIDWSPWED